MNTTEVIYAERAYTALLSLLVLTGNGSVGRLTDSSESARAKLKIESCLAVLVRGFGNVSKIIDPNSLDKTVVRRHNDVSDVPMLPFTPREKGC